MIPIFITGNKNKVEETSRILGIKLENQKIDVPEIQSLNIEEVVSVKAKSAYEALNTPVLVEDTSLIFNTLGQLPGPFIRFFVDALGNEKICRLLDSFTDRSAVAVVVFALCDEQGIQVYRGEMSGQISNQPLGSNGFGWDAIFIPTGSEKTYAEMTPEEKDRFSFRAKALEKLRPILMKEQW